ncbi:phosphatase PAP2 family protein [Gemella sp. GH3]|uniref:phosphatase PAP2 family protein n=1 Tax=unclassified Gemella TaxID=2624949 RepID=UPI0015D01970|nr:MULTISPECIES: phosphatase PAP2 family protein [unclassified Gemella]MBF0714323.1 phosphatase PAP2 family protein [Gemella sp. GH3.1]NYS51275.1 phosphatase PAP2 family protein [Gemella sp. GH3]
MKDIKIITYTKAVLFFMLLFIAVLYPNNLFDYILSDIATSVVGGVIFGSIGKAISYILHDKILLLLMGMLGLFLFFTKNYKKSIFILSTAFFGSVLALFFKNVIHRSRPLDIYDGFSFPSGHATVATIFFLSLLFIVNSNKVDILKKITPIAIVLICVSRVIVGAHYITDVVAGVLLGSIVVDLVKIFYINIYTIFSNITGYEDEK